MRGRKPSQIEISKILNVKAQESNAKRQKNERRVKPLELNVKKCWQARVNAILLPTT